jgi:hypothetical protein
LLDFISLRVEHSNILNEAQLGSSPAQKSLNGQIVRRYVALKQRFNASKSKINGFERSGRLLGQKQRVPTRLHFSV